LRGVKSDVAGVVARCEAVEDEVHEREMAVRGSADRHVNGVEALRAEQRRQSAALECLKAMCERLATHTARSDYAEDIVAAPSSRSGGVSPGDGVGLEERIENLENKIWGLGQARALAYAEAGRATDHRGSCAQSPSLGDELCVLHSQNARLKDHVRRLERAMSTPAKHSYKTPSPVAADDVHALELRASTPEKVARDIAGQSVQERLHYFENLLGHRRRSSSSTPILRSVAFPVSAQGGGVRAGSALDPGRRGEERRCVGDGSRRSLLAPTL